MLELWLARLDRLLVTVNIALMGLMTLMVMTAVILRYVFSISFAGSEEAVSLIFVMTSLLGSVCVARRNDHIGVDFIYGWVSADRIRWVRLGVSVAVIVTMLVMINASFAWIGVSMTVPTPAMQLPFWWFYSFLPVAFALVVLVEAGKIVRTLSTWTGDKHP
jgi:TRAP-type C4-dicarboxylate transport system permease small subunit